MLLFVGILWRDVNRSNRYKRQLEAANRHNEALLEAREKLMLTITHDIKAPLGSIMGYIDLLYASGPGQAGCALSGSYEELGRSSVGVGDRPAGFL